MKKLLTVEQALAILKDPDAIKKDKELLLAAIRLVGGAPLAPPPEQGEEE